MPDYSFIARQPTRTVADYYQQGQSHAASLAQTKAQTEGIGIENTMRRLKAAAMPESIKDADRDRDQANRINAQSEEFNRITNEYAEGREQDANRDRDANRKIKDAAEKRAKAQEDRANTSNDFNITSSYSAVIKDFRQFGDKTDLESLSVYQAALKNGLTPEQALAMAQNHNRERIEERRHEYNSFRQFFERESPDLISNMPAFDDGITEWRLEDAIALAQQAPLPKLPSGYQWRNDDPSQGAMRIPGTEKFTRVSEEEIEAAKDILSNPDAISGSFKTALDDLDGDDKDIVERALAQRIKSLQMNQGMSYLEAAAQATKEIDEKLIYEPDFLSGKDTALDFSGDSVRQIAPNEFVVPGSKQTIRYNTETGEYQYVGGY